MVGTHFTRTIAKPQLACHSNAGMYRFTAHVFAMNRARCVQPPILAEEIETLVQDVSDSASRQVPRPTRGLAVVVGHDADVVPCSADLVQCSKGGIYKGSGTPTQPTSCHHTVALLLQAPVLSFYHRYQLAVITETVRE